MKQQPHIPDHAEIMDLLTTYTANSLGYDDVSEVQPHHRVSEDLDMDSLDRIDIAYNMQKALRQNVGVLLTEEIFADALTLDDVGWNIEAALHGTQNVDR